MPVKGAYLALTGAGALLVWSGLRGKSWSATLRDVLQGKKPETATTAYSIQGGSVTGGASPAGGGKVPNVRGFWNSTTLAALWISQGGSPSTARNAACHGMQESSGNARVTSSNPDGGINVGLWQLDTKGVGAGYTVAQLQNPVTNARITVRATRNGQDWSQWATPGC